MKNLDVQKKIRSVHMLESHTVPTRMFPSLRGNLQFKFCSVSNSTFYGPLKTSLYLGDLEAKRKSDFKDMMEREQQNLEDEYVEEILMSADSTSHKEYMLRSNDCFIEWCQEKLDRMNGVL